MKLVTFKVGEDSRVGALVGDGRVLDLTTAEGGCAEFCSMQTLIEAGPAALDKARRQITLWETSPTLALADVRLQAPLPRPVRLRDCSLFLEHMEKALLVWARNIAAAGPDPEAALDQLMASGKFTMKPIFRDKVLYYNADAGSVSGPGEDVIWPTDSDYMDYELEWACVIGKGGIDIASGQAADHIFGYTVFNDWSARDIQLPIMEGNLGPGEGKDFPGGYGLGPCIVTRDELPDPYDLLMTARVNGREWSRGSTSSMHHRFEDAVVSLSRSRRLVAGEVIGSGTVLSGCGYELGRRLEPDDLVELEVEGVGVLSNHVRRNRSI